jgi:hypothetical protein
VHSAAIIVLAAALATPCALSSVCPASSRHQTAASAAIPCWTLDHYVYDASLHQDWEVLIDCNHPEAPAQIKLTQNTRRAQVTRRTKSQLPVLVAIHAGAAVEVSSAADSPASIRLYGTAMETAFDGQPIRVRLNVSGHFVSGLVRGPHAVQLVPAAKPLWRQP